MFHTPLPHHHAAILYSYVTILLRRTWPRCWRGSIGNDGNMRGGECESRASQVGGFGRAPNRARGGQRAQLRDKEREVRFGQQRSLSESLASLSFRSGQEGKRSHGGNCERELNGRSRSVEARKAGKERREAADRKS